ncbi:Fis family transcriptional regulator [Shewanella kaireitica]|uniref:Fis family transcriptional regulator n=1 Tax=Shewanella kaireitica TaxID=212021 RepID=UPI00200D7B82|nr:Fis family transcriptional regulator [Shewanella kaireitica]MCL1094694.1 Fis family transcriptional regulator [Shewanella kaireitica]
MRKSDKKIENTIRIVLTEVCERLKGQVVGFEWLTHKVNFNNVNQTLTITFMFDSFASLRSAKAQLKTDEMAKEAANALAKQNIHLKNFAKQCHFDTDERNG